MSLDGILSGLTWQLYKQSTRNAARNAVYREFDTHGLGGSIEIASRLSAEAATDPFAIPRPTTSASRPRRGGAGAALATGEVLIRPGRMRRGA